MNYLISISFFIVAIATKSIFASDNHLNPTRSAAPANLEGQQEAINPSEQFIQDDRERRLRYLVKTTIAQGGRWATLHDYYHRAEAFHQAFQYQYQSVMAHGWDSGLDILVENVQSQPLPADHVQDDDALRTAVMALMDNRQLISILDKKEQEEGLGENELELRESRKKANEILERALEDRKQRLMRDKRDLIQHAFTESCTGCRLMGNLMAQAAEAFERDSRKLISILQQSGKSEEDIQRWRVQTLQDFLCKTPTATSTPQEDAPIAKLYSEWTDYQKEVKNKEIDHLNATIFLLESRIAELNQFKEAIDSSSASMLEGLEDLKKTLDLEINTLQGFLARDTTQRDSLIKE